MHKNIVAFFILLALTGYSFSDDKDITKNFFGYGSVEKAIDELSSAPGAQIKETNDRTIISFEAEKVRWEFPSKSQPYYPSIIKSQVILSNGKIDYQVNIACQAEEAKCEEISKLYAAHVEDVKQQLSQ
jgi:hypothetical protein